MREAEVRDAVRRRIDARRGDETCLVMQEFGLAQAGARIDLAVVGRRLTGWEIKTGLDTLARLPAQQEAYSRVFDHMWLAADARHVERALGMVPDWWGVVRVEPSPGGPRLRPVRPGRLNRGVEPWSLVRLLWRDEVLGELETLGMAEGLGRASRGVLWDALAASVPGRLSVAALQRRVRARLTSREGWRAASPRG